MRFELTRWQTSIWTAVICWFMVLPSWAQSTRPTTDKLLPETTVMYIQLQNLRELAQDFRSTNFGRMLQDEKVAPLIDDLFAQAKEAYADVQDQVGLSWEDFENLPTGEICFAAVAPKRADMQFALFMDIDPETDVADRVMKRGLDLVEEQGGTVEEAEEGEVKFTTATGPDGVKLTQFRMGNTMVVVTDKKLAEEIVKRWRGEKIEKVRPLTENRKFVTVMNRCRGTKETPPEMRFFVDPIEMIRAATRGDVGTQAALNFLPVLGLDGLLAIGGASMFDEQGLESISHMHVLLSSPKIGILEMLALKPGEYKPQKWLADDTTTYLSTSIDLKKMYTELAKIVDTFGGEDTMKKQVDDNLQKELELSLQEDILPALNGRITTAQGFVAPLTLNSQITALGLGIADQEKLKTVLDKIKDRINNERRENVPDQDEDFIQTKEHEGVTYWTIGEIADQQREAFEQMRESGEMRLSIRPTSPSFAIIEDTLVICDSEEYIKSAIETSTGDKPGLGDNDQMTEVARKMSTMLGTDMPAAFFYSQPANTFRWMLDMADSDDTKNALDELEDEDNKYLRRFKRGLANNPVPKFSDVEKYFAPSGGFITSDETGYHFLFFNLKANID